MGEIPLLIHMAQRGLVELSKHLDARFGRRLHDCHWTHHSHRTTCACNSSSVAAETWVCMSFWLSCKHMASTKSTHSFSFPPQNNQTSTISLQSSERWCRNLAGLSREHFRLLKWRDLCNKTNLWRARPPSHQVKPRVLESLNKLADEEHSLLPSVPALSPSTSASDMWFVLTSCTEDTTLVPRLVLDRI